MLPTRTKSRNPAPDRPIGWPRPGLTFGPALRALLLGALAALFAAAILHANPARAQTQKPAMQESRSTAEFRKFIAGVWPEAQARGVSRAVFDAALGNVTIDPSIGRISAKQAEFVRPVWEYVNSAVSQQRIERGRALAREHAATLAQIERRFGADPYVVLAIWGIETSFGSFTGNKNVFRSLATLAFRSHRTEFFRNELLNALQILQEGHASAAVMTGSWAGAMGHTQFMPSSFIRFAVDHTGDGRKDIWRSVPDALASTANYLASHGWAAGMTWGYEVTLPAGFDVSPHDPQAMRPFPEWARLGLRRVDGQPMPAGGEGALLLPAGVRGPAFVVTRNYAVIRSYNNSQAYMLAVALLSDRIAGAGPLTGRWPTGDKPLSTNQAKEMQRSLERMGFKVGEIDGRIGQQVQAAVRAYQRREGLVADGYATQALLERMRKQR